MKKALVILLAAIISCSIFSGCNRQLIDVTYTYNYVYISLPTGEVIEGKLSSWRDYDDSDMIQVEVDGNMYLTHINNVVLVKKK